MSYFTLQQVKDSIAIVFGSQLTRKDDNVDIKSNLPSIIFEMINDYKFVETLKRRHFQRNQTA